MRSLEIVYEASSCSVATVIPWPPMSECFARADGIDVNVVADGYVVYDPARDRVHYLNHTAALILEFCTGENSQAEIVEMLQLAYELPEPPEDEVKDCIDLLRGEGLIA
jgi:hypothetical protein